MPKYDYRCQVCGWDMTVKHSFDFRFDSDLTCPLCGGSIRKVIGAAPIAFRGSGFYRTDNGPKTS